MKTYLLAITTIICISFCSCKKEDTKEPSINTADSVVYSFVQIPDLTMEQYSEYAASFEVKPMPEKEEDMSFKITGLPKYMDYEFVKQPNDNKCIVSLKLIAEQVATGIYPQTISANNTTSTMSFNINIIETTECAEYMAGTYTDINTGKELIISTDKTAKNSISIEVQHMKIDIDCDNKTLRIYGGGQDGSLYNYVQYTGTGTFRKSDLIEFQYVKTNTITNPTNTSEQWTTNTSFKYNLKR